MLAAIRNPTTRGVGWTRTLATQASSSGTHSTHVLTKGGRTHVRQPERRRPDLHEPGRTARVATEGCFEAGRLAQDKRDRPQRPRLDHFGNKKKMASWKRRRWISLRSQVELHEQARLGEGPSVSYLLMIRKVSVIC